jgi:predicted transcriptional regulator
VLLCGEEDRAVAELTVTLPDDLAAKLAQAAAELNSTPQALLAEAAEWWLDEAAHGVAEAETAYDPELDRPLEGDELAAYARARGASEEEIAAVMAGIAASERGEEIDQEIVFARWRAKYG